MTGNDEILFNVSESWRHHYIPEFHLNGFTNGDNQFMIYLVPYSRFKKNGIFFSPQSHFFKEHDNTTFTDAGNSDFLEQEYAKLDSMVSLVFNKLKTNEQPRYGITPYERALLQWYVSILYWRIPSNQELLNYLGKNKPFKSLGFTLRSTETHELLEEPELEEKIKNNPNFSKFLRFHIPMATYPSLFESNDETSFYTFPDQLPAIFGDNPLILRNPEKFDLYRDDFILPLTKNIIFIRGRKLKKEFNVRVKVEIDMLVLMQSKEYACTTDKKYLELLKTVFHNEFKTLENLRNSIFNQLCEEMI